MTANNAMKIGDLMTAVIANVSPEHPLADAVKLMRQKRCSCVLVTEGGKPTGILTERNLVEAFSDALETQTLPSGTVADVMSPDPVRVKASTSLYDALMLARSRRLRHLLVVDETGTLVGLVTQTDMVNAYVGLVERQAELESRNRELLMLSNEDALMGIGNRRAMMVELEFTEAAARRYSKTYAAALIDVDFFKRYNDEYGHRKGDEALKLLAKVVQENMRESDRLYRYGGEELLLLMPEAGAVEAYCASERVRAAVEAVQLPHKDSPFGVLTVSIGVSADQAQSWQVLVEKADQALYRAKEAGRNRVSDNVTA